jgi:hypothetical protein
MATANHDCVGKALDRLRPGLETFLWREFAHTYHSNELCSKKRLDAVYGTDVRWRA